MHDEENSCAQQSVIYMSFDLVPNCVTANGVAHPVQAEMGPDGCNGVRLPRSPDEHGDVRRDGRGDVVVDVVGPTDHLDGPEPGREDRPPLRHRLLLRHRQSQPHSLRGVRGRRSECIQPAPVDIIPKKQNHQTNQPQHCHRSVKIRRKV